MKTELHARSLRLGAVILTTYLVALSITGPLFAQSNPCAEPLKEGVYNHYKERTLVHKYSNMKDYFKSDYFEQDVKKGSWGGGVSIPIAGVPFGINASSSKDAYKEFRRGIEELSENQLDEVLAREVDNSEPNTGFAKEYFDCVKRTLAAGFSWDSELVGGRAFVTIRFAPISKSNPMPVLTEDVKVYNATDIAVLPKKGQALDYLTLISGVPKDIEKQVTVEMYTNQGPVYASSPLPGTSPTSSAPTTPLQLPVVKESFEVLGIGHKDKTHGKYFGFEASDLDAILGRKDWDDTLIFVSLMANGSFRHARVWRSSNGTAGTAHGRYETGWKAGDWSKGQTVYVQPVSK